ncbi:NBS-containing resistance-like protein [Trifolium pratense]|uniref:NBS-containing resistance-like protein n=1 Tax=Trifolium pratense TaxID=57577 RepID=A0A2K3LAT3_TRIPR|nr:NBS-containing resistance-like protein [Trifolium pratense]
MLRQLRRLGVRRVRSEHGNALSAAIVEMKHLENLNITTITADETINLNFVSSPPQLQRLHLKAKLDALPDWIPKLEYLVELKLALSKLKDDPLMSLKSLPNLLKLCILDNAYDGEILHFQNGGFLKLKKLNISRLNRVNSIIIENGALLSLENILMNKIPQVKEVPSGIKHLDNLKDIYFTDMPAEFSESIDPDTGQHYCIIKHVPLVFIRHWVGPNLLDFDIRTIHSSSEESQTN